MSDSFKHTFAIFQRAHFCCKCLPCCCLDTSSVVAVVVAISLKKIKLNCSAKAIRQVSQSESVRLSVEVWTFENNSLKVKISLPCSRHMHEDTQYYCALQLYCSFSNAFTFFAVFPSSLLSQGRLRCLNFKSVYRLNCCMRHLPKPRLLGWALMCMYVCMCMCVCLNSDTTYLHLKPV